MDRQSLLDNIDVKRFRRKELASLIRQLNEASSCDIDIRTNQVNARVTLVGDEVNEFKEICSRERSRLWTDLILLSDELKASVLEE